MEKDIESETNLKKKERRSDILKALWKYAKKLVKKKAKWPIALVELEEYRNVWKV